VKRWFLLALTACTTFEPVARNTCGNGVLEPGEDCDSTDATCVHCAVMCSTAADCPNDGYACGVDGACHAPGGALGPAVEAGQFFTDDMRITDIDDDGIGDVVGVSRTSLVVRHGDPGASLVRTDAQFTPSQAGPASFADLDGDNTLDVTIATPDGLVSYASPYKALSPLDVRDVLVDNATMQPLDARMIFAIPPTALGAFVAQNGVMAFEVVDLNPLNGSNGALPCGVLDAAQFSPDLVDVYEKNNETIVALTSKNGGKLCVLDVYRSAGAINIAQLTGANAPVVMNKPILADLDSDGDYCPDVITSDGGPQALLHRNGTAVGGHCTLGLEAALPPISQLPAVDPLRGRVALTPQPIGFVPDALVFEDSIVGFTGSAWGVGYSSPRPIARAIDGDLDGDGMTDVLISAEGTDDISILYRSSALFASYDEYRLDTLAPVTAMTLGDFDGDGNVDIDYSERVGDHQRMMVSYGAGSRPTPPIEVGTFADITSLAPLSPQIFNDPNHQITDLIVLSPDPNGGPPAFTFLLGSAQRSLLPLYDPRPGGSQALLRTAVVASFTGDPAPDIFAIATLGGAAVGWQVAGPLSAYADAKRPTFLIDDAVDCSRGPSAGPLCADDALSITWPGAQHDTVLEVDHAGHAIAFDPAAAMVTNATTMTGTLATTHVTTFAGHSGVRTLARVDLDGSGTPKLLATFDDAVLVCPMGPGAVPSGTCDDIATKIGDPGITCTDAATGHFGFTDTTTATTAGTDLVALCHAGGESIIYRVHDGTADVLLRTPRDLRALRAGDITGDGLDDLVAIAGGQGDQSLVAFPQCSSRTLATCQLGAHR
jgi:hypothetical protein